MSDDSQTNMHQSGKSIPTFRESLARGQIPAGQTTISANVNRERLLKDFADRFEGKPKEWKVNNEHWTRDKVVINILWYPSQSVFFTFRNGDLVLVEFPCLGTPDSKWDYFLEVQKYFRTKRDVLTHLGEENSSNESNTQNLETVWEFSDLIVYLACDAKTGGCGIGLRPRRQSNLSTNASELA
ncbi:MAG: hypothetical protein H0U60_18695 [Blastocatellia bacterium]|nr:hypothetical protein [Blastocatellia bacterium]